MPDLKTIALYALAVLTAISAAAAWEYKRMYKATDFALTTQNEAIQSQKRTAADLLARRTAERDALQEKLDQRAAAQGKTDEQATGQIARDDAVQRSTPVVVRVRDCARPAGGSGGSAAGGAPAGAAAGAADAGAASGVLPQENSRRLADALNEVETMSSAYSSCRATLLPE